MLAAAAVASSALAAAGGSDVSGLALSEPVISERGPVRTSGATEVVVQLSKPGLAAAVKAAGTLDGGAQQAHLEGVEAQQDAFGAQLGSLGGRELGRVAKSLNAVVVSVDASRVADLRALPDVTSVRPLGRYQLDLRETVPYIGAADLQDLGVDGTGVDVAVLDSGIDYTHENLGGAGTLAAYEAAYGTSTTDPRNTTLDGLFPTEKVVGGFDFVGEDWPNSPEQPDPDPIDFEGHGTHVADIVGGRSADGTHVGVAPGVSLWAVKVCSAVSTSCSGLALLQAVDFSLDPDGDGDLSDRVDVMNLSLGSSYGQREDDLSAALAHAVDLGVVVVASAGNGANRQYIVGSPSTEPKVISVAQTQVPSSRLYLIEAGGITVGGSLQAWSGPLAGVVSGELAYDTASAGTRRGCTDAAGTSPFAAGSHVGQVLLLDRGTCAVSMKVANAKTAGAVAAIVANNAAQGPGELPPDFSYGGGDASIPGLTVTLVDGTSLKSVVGATAGIDPASAVSLVQNMVSSSSRGPSRSYQAIKPDLGAPGASVSAEAGTGDGETAFGGTSGAAPMVSGAAALLLDGRPGLAPAEVKALLMNTGETDIGINPVGRPGYRAPITSIGGGEVRVGAAYASGTAAWDSESQAGSLSFGYHALSSPATLHRTVTVRNYTGVARTYAISPSFRYADDQAGGAVSVAAPGSVSVPAHGSAQFEVAVTVDPDKLPVWELNGGSRGGDGWRLDVPEFDGYVTLDGGANNTVHLAWHLLPHRSAAVALVKEKVNLKKRGTAEATLSNASGVLDGRVESFSLTGTSGRFKEQELPRPGDNFAAVDLKSVGVRDAGGGLVQFAVATHGKRAHPNYPAEFDIFVDSDADPDPDYVIFNAENGGFGATGQNLVFFGPLPSGPFGAAFFTDADLNSEAVILTVPAAGIGVTSAASFDFSVFGCDNYFTGICTDAIENMRYTLGTPRYTAGPISLTVAKGGAATMPIGAVAGGSAASPSQSGFLLVYRDAAGSVHETQELEVFAPPPFRR